MASSPDPGGITLQHPEFAGGCALVIGGSGAIGGAICRTLARAGSDVVVGYHGRVEAAESVVHDVMGIGQRGHAAKADLLQPESLLAVVNETVRRYGYIHSVVYAAGPPIEFKYINEILPVEWARVMQLDVNGCFNLVSAVLPHLRQRKAGAIVALITAAVDRAPPRDILSAAPKSAIQMLIRGVAREEGRSGIRANCVGPGYIAAGLGAAAVHDHTRDYVERMVKAIPLRRAGQPDEVADVVCFLLSNKARYVTGESIAVAGGLQLS